MPSNLDSSLLDFLQKPVPKQVKLDGLSVLLVQRALAAGLELKILLSEHPLKHDLFLPVYYLILNQKGLIGVDSFNCFLNKKPGNMERLHIDIDLSLYWLILEPS